MKLKQFEDFQLYVRDEKDWGFWQNDTFEPEETELIKPIVKSTDVCLDIGANIGYFTILMAKQCRWVYAFEPEPSNMELLGKNLWANRIENVSGIKAAVSDKVGDTELYLCDVNNGMHRLYKSRFCTKLIDVDTIDVDSMALEPNFIKMDVEGAELDALKGMEQTLNKYHPTIVMEYHPPSIEEKGDNPKEIYDLLKSLDYKIYLIPNIKEEFSYEDLYLQTDDQSGGQNILCQNKI